MITVILTETTHVCEVVARDVVENPSHNAAILHRGFELFKVIAPRIEPAVKATELENCIAATAELFAQADLLSCGNPRVSLEPE